MTVKWWSASYNQSPKCCGINSELNNRYFDYFYSNFDIFCWSKTKSNIYDLSGTAVNDYSVFKIHDDDDGLFATHGMCVLVNRKIAEFCKITKATLKQVLWFQMGKEVPGYKINVGSIYLTNESSKYHSAHMFDDICFDIVSFDSPIHIYGDANSRTGICLLMPLARMIMLLSCMFYRNIGKGV